MGDKRNREGRFPDSHRARVMPAGYVGTASRRLR